MNYLEKAVELIKAEQERTGKRIHHVNIFHDAWCSIYQGKNCDCDPIVEIAKPSPAESAMNN